MENTSTSLDVLSLSKAARKALERVGVNTVEELEPHLERLTELTGIGGKLASEIGAKHKAWKEQTPRSHRSLPAFYFRLCVFGVLVASAIVSLIALDYVQKNKPEIARNSGEFSSVLYSVVCAVVIPALGLGAADFLIFQRRATPQYRVHWLQGSLSAIALIAWVWVYWTGMYDALFVHDYVSARQHPLGQVTPPVEHTLLFVVQDVITRSSVFMTFAIGLGLFPYGEPKS